ncbi:MAG TPA: extracellular solute-binding protein [Anaerolineaceae bacterium]|nr:extracellular solute-binding protein [Anaerolineaceae bacterium]
MQRHLYRWAGILILIGMILAACSKSPQPLPEEQPTQALASITPAPSVSPTPEAVKQVVQEALDFQRAPQQPRESAKTTNLVLWHRWSADELVAIDQVIEDYQSTHPGVTVELITPPNFDSTVDIAIQAGLGPDVIAWNNSVIGSLAEHKNIVPLDGPDLNQGLLFDLFEPAAANGVIWKGKIWGLPQAQSGLALVYNKEIVKEEYLPKDPLDFAALLDRARQFQTNTGKTLICNPGFSSGSPDVAGDLAPVFFGFGIPMYVDENGRGFLDTPEAINAADWLSSLNEVSPAENSPETCKDSFEKGDVGMWWTGPQAIPGIEKSGINYGILPMGKPMVDVQALMLTQNAVDRGNQSIALDLMRYLSGQEVQKKLALLNRTIPTTSVVFDDAEIARELVVTGFGDALRLGIARSPSPFAAAVKDPLAKAIQAIWSGSAAPEEAMKTAQEELDVAVEKLR